MYDFLFKIVVFGDYNTGKTSFLNYLQNYKLLGTYEPTIGVEYSTKIIELYDDTKIKLTFWDCAGQERFRSVTNNFFKDVTAGILFFDVSCKKSYENVIPWIKNFREHNSDKVPIILIGNKIDKDRCVSKSDVYILATDYDVVYIEISVKNGININNAIDLLIDKIISEKESNPNIIKYEEKEPLILNKKPIRYTCTECCIC